MANVGAPTEPPIVDALTLVTHRRRYALSANGGIPESPGDASTSAPSTASARDRAHRRPLPQRGLPAGPHLRRAVPIRHRRQNFRVGDRRRPRIYQWRSPGDTTPFDSPFLDGASMLP